MSHSLCSFIICIMLISIQNVAGQSTGPTLAISCFNIKDGNACNRQGKSVKGLDTCVQFPPSPVPHCEDTPGCQYVDSPDPDGKCPPRCLIWNVPRCDECRPDWRCWHHTPCVPHDVQFDKILGYCYLVDRKDQAFAIFLDRPNGNNFPLWVWITAGVLILLALLAAGIVCCSRIKARKDVVIYQGSRSINRSLTNQMDAQQPNVAGPSWRPYQWKAPAKTGSRLSTIYM